MDMDVHFVQRTARANPDWVRAVRRLVAVERTEMAAGLEAAESEMAEDLAYQAARLIRFEAWVAQRSHRLSYRAYSGLLEEMA
jgi:hypothetical protein